MGPNKVEKVCAGLLQRNFFWRFGATAPTINLMEGDASGVPRPDSAAEVPRESGKFSDSIELSAYLQLLFGGSGTRENAR